MRRVLVELRCHRHKTVMARLRELPDTSKPLWIYPCEKCNAWSSYWDMAKKSKKDESGRPSVVIRVEIPNHSVEQLVQRVRAAGGRKVIEYVAAGNDDDRFVSLAATENEDSPHKST